METLDNIFDKVHIAFSFVGNIRASLNQKLTSLIKNSAKSSLDICLGLEFHFNTNFHGNIMVFNLKLTRLKIERQS